jgi:stearoyl-CoA desaturase (delta-9 desaturase)
LNTTIPNPTFPTGAPATLSREVVVNAHLVRTQKAYAWVTILVPTTAMLYAAIRAVSGLVTPGELVLFLVFYFVTLMGITVGFHRLVAHRGFRAGRAVKIAFAVLGTWAAQGPVLHWVSNHRRHHRHSDRVGDPHSPNLSGTGAWNRTKGIAHAHIGSMFADEVPNYAKFVPDLLRDHDIVWIHRHYISIVASGLLWGGLVRIFVVHHAIWSITSIAHTFGVKRYDSRDGSRNSLLLALLTGGEGLHNTHHAHPRAAIFAASASQIDMGGMVVRILEAVGWAWDVHRVPRNVPRASHEDR